MKTCPGYWPDPGTPCQRILSAGDHCPKAADPDHGYHAERKLDPRWDWVEVSTYTQPDQWIKGECKHLTPDPVTVTDPVTEDVILVAWLCADCDGQFPPERFTRDTDPFAEDDDPRPWTTWPEIPQPNGFERWVYGTSPEYRAAYATEGRFNYSDVGRTIPPREAEERLARRRSDDHLIFVAGGVINRNARPPWYVRAGRAYWAAFVEIWEAQKRAVVVFLDTLGFMWPVYLVGLDYLMKVING